MQRPIMRTKQHATRWTTVLASGLASVLALLLSLSLAGPAQAQQWPTADPSYNAPDPSLKTLPDTFGTPGQIVISSDFDIDLRFISQSFMGNSNSTKEFSLSPNALFFLAPNLAVGGELGLDYSSFEGGSLTGLSVGPLAAYNIPISLRVSLFPTVGLLYSWGQLEQTLPGGRSTTSGYDISLVVRAPLLFHPFQNVFVGVVPFTELDLVAKQEGDDTSKTRTLGVTLDIGFWM